MNAPNIIVTPTKEGLLIKQEPFTVRSHLEAALAQLQDQPGIQQPSSPLSLKPAMVKLAANGERLPDSADNHVAIYLPEYLRVFRTRKWERAGSWQESKQLAAQCRLFNREDWLSAESREAMLLVDHDFREPACNPVYLADMPHSDIVWTATELKPAKNSSSPDCAFYVLFDYGNVRWSYQGDGGFVLPVLRVAPGQF